MDSGGEHGELERIPRRVEAGRKSGEGIEIEREEKRKLEKQSCCAKIVAGWLPWSEGIGGGAVPNSG